MNETNELAASPIKSYPNTEKYIPLQRKGLTAKQQQVFSELFATQVAYGPLVEL